MQSSSRFGVKDKKALTCFIIEVRPKPSIGPYAQQMGPSMGKPIQTRMGPRTAKALAPRVGNLMFFPNLPIN